MEECWVAVWEEGQKSIRAEALVRRRGKHLQGGERDWTEGESSVLWGGRSDQDSRVREQRLDLMGKVKWVVGWRGSPSRASAAPSSRSRPSPPLLPQAGMRRPALKMGCDLTCWYRWPRPSAALAASLGATTSWPAGSCPTTCAESSLCACLGTLAPTAWRHCDRNPHCTHVAWTLANKQMSHHLWPRLLCAPRVGRLGEGLPTGRLAAQGGREGRCILGLPSTEARFRVGLQPAGVS